jgi:hypothetical protein
MCSERSSQPTSIPLSFNPVAALGIAEKLLELHVGYVLNTPKLGLVENGEGYVFCRGAHATLSMGF